MIISIQQPNYLPYLGFFDKMRRSDIFVIYDDPQFNSRDFQHRNKIRTSEGWQWLTVPVEKEQIPINQIKIKNNTNWRDAHFTAIRANYYKTNFFKDYQDELKKIYEIECEYLIDINMKVINFIKKTFDINTKIVYSSELGKTSKSTQHLIDIVEALGGDTYLSGPGGKRYMDLGLIAERNIKVEFQDFVHPVYPQRYPDFIPNMSSIDALFNVGKFPI